MNRDISKLREQLKTQRDELIVQAHLAKAELKDEWAVLEEKWQQAENKFHHLQDEAIETTEEMKQSAHIIMEEISIAYKNIKARLED